MLKKSTWRLYQELGSQRKKNHSNAHTKLKIQFASTQNFTRTQKEGSRENDGKEEEEEEVNVPKIFERQIYVFVVRNSTIDGNALKYSFKM